MQKLDISTHNIIHQNTDTSPNIIANFTPIALTIAGSDSSGGAGIQADLKSFSANHVYGASVITAITAQNTCTVNAVFELPEEIVTNQISTLLDDLNISAIKIGMLFSEQIINAVASSLADCNIPIILDPVMIAKSGDKLLQEQAIECMIERLFPLCDLITPNLPEAAQLLQLPQADTLESMQQQAESLLALGAKAVLLKGGHSLNPICHDCLVTSNGLQRHLTAKRIDTPNTHGTGCTYSAAICAQIANGHSLEASVIIAHEYLQKAIKTADQLQIGKSQNKHQQNYEHKFGHQRGHGPVHHFHHMWPTK